MACESAMGQYSVLIIGAGRIGAFFDSPQSETILTHAHAFSSHPGFELKGFVDADPREAERAALLWSARAFDPAAYAREEFDVAVVATPDESHYHLLRELADRPLKLVFAEKPLALSRTEAESIVLLYRERGIGLAVNYSRRFVPDFAYLRDKIAEHEFGKYLTGTGYYGKGILHNGSHMIDLLRFLLGDPAKVTTLGAIRDWSDNDPTCSARLEMAEGGQFLLQGLDCRCYTVFEMDLLFEKARVRMLESGFAIEVYGVIDSEIFAGYRILSPGKRQAVNLGSALADAVENLYGYLSTGIELACTGEEALRALDICAQILGGLG